MKRLEGKNIYYVVTGAKKAKLANIFIKEIVSEGANVFTIPTKSALDFFDCDKLKNIKNNVIKIGWTDDIKLPKEDAILIAPCTFNTLNSIASGLANTYPLCLIASGIGNKVPIFIAPAMNKSLWNHPIMGKNLKRLESWGCRLIWPEIKKDKVTMIDPGKILDTLYFSFCRVNYQDKRIDSDKMNNKLNKYRNKYLSNFQSIGKFLLKNNLNLPTAGCISIKVPDGFLITSSGSDLASLSKCELCLIHSWDKKNIQINYVGEFLPSSETPLHCKIHEQSNKKYILHFHCPEMTYHEGLNKYNTDKYIRYGYFETGNSVWEKLKKEKFCIMKYHGEVLIGDDVGDLVNIINKFRLQ